VTALAYDGRLLVAGCADGAIRLWEVETGQAHDLVQAKATALSVYSVAYSPDGKTLASAGANGTILLWDVASRQPRPPMLDGQFLPAEAVVFASTGMLAASGCTHFDDAIGICDQTQISLWDSSSWELRARLTEPALTTEHLAFSPDGALLASAGCARTDAAGYCIQGQVVLRDVATGELRPPLEGHTDAVKRVAFSPDGRLLASASYDRSVIVWDVATGQPVGQRLVGHGYYALSVVFSPDGATLLSGGVRLATSGRGFQGEVILWDVATGQQLGGPFLAHRLGPKDLAISPDGRRLISASYDGTVIVWDLDWDSWRERACRLANRNLTAEEWTQFFGSEPYQATCP
jgi:WD40 repeat protein